LPKEVRQLLRRVGADGIAPLAGSGGESCGPEKVYEPGSKIIYDTSYCYPGGKTGIAPRPTIRNHTWTILSAANCKGAYVWVKNGGTRLFVASTSAQVTAIDLDAGTSASIHTWSNEAEWVGFCEFEQSATEYLTFCAKGNRSEVWDGTIAAGASVTNTSAPSAQCVCAFNNQVVMADDVGQLHFSNDPTKDAFDATKVYTIQVGVGGRDFGLEPFQGSLYAFREQALIRVFPAGTGTGELYGSEIKAEGIGLQGFPGLARGEGLISFVYGNRIYVFDGTSYPVRVSGDFDGRIPALANSETTGCPSLEFFNGSLWASYQDNLLVCGDLAKRNWFQVQGGVTNGIHAIMCTGKAKGSAYMYMVPTLNAAKGSYYSISPRLYEDDQANDYGAAAAGGRFVFYTLPFDFGTPHNRKKIKSIIVSYNEMIGPYFEVRALAPVFRSLSGEGEWSPLVPSPREVFKATITGFTGTTRHSGTIVLDVNESTNKNDAATSFFLHFKDAQTSKALMTQWDEKYKPSINWIMVVATDLNWTEGQPVLT